MMKELKAVYNTDKIEKALEKVVREKEVILSSTGSVAVEEIALGAGAPNVSLRTIVGITPVDSPSGTYPIPRYYNTDILNRFKAGNTIDTHTFAELTSVPYDLSEDTGTGSLSDIVNADIDLHDDAKEIVEKGMDIEHEDRLINSENTEICNALLENKNVITTTPETLGATMIGTLCAKALRNARIITNMTGFSKLDIKISGIALIKRDSNGNFIYDDKYIVDVLDDEILPNLDSGAPIIAGDITNSVTILVNNKAYIKDFKAKDNDSSMYVFQRRYKDKELVLRLTDSDKAYSVASLA